MNNVVTGVVQRGQGLGAGLGFRTLNLPAPNEIDDGVYVVAATVNGERHNAVASLGAAPAVDRDDRWLEVHVYDVNLGSCYGQEVQVEFLQRVRDILDFVDIDALQLALEGDVEYARNFFLRR